jgi:hypothetical protein
VPKGLNAVTRHNDQEITTLARKQLCRAGVDLLGSAAAIGKAIEDIDEGDTVVIDPNGPARKKR